MSAPCLLVAGAAGVGKSSLVQGITGAPAAAPATPWLVQNKYYSARVEVRESREVASTGAMPEALVLVFSLQDASTLQSAQDACSGFDLEQVEVKLLCGTHADALLAGGVEAADLETPAQPEWFQRALDWSIEHGFELVVCSPGVPGTDAALALDGDRQGVARVVEALQAHT
ncbi:hypothetical protein TSOC_015188, partial [Tetrabaena socialis]